MQPDQNQPLTPAGPAPAEPAQTPQPGVVAPPQPAAQPEVVAPVQPTPQVTTPWASAQTQSTDPTQLGYVPPASPNPGMITPNPVLPSESKGKFGGKLKTIIIVVVALIGFSGAGILLKDVLFSGSAIKTSDLVEEEAEGIKFKRPKQWVKAPDEGGMTVFTEEGKKTEESDQGMIVGNESLGISFESLTADQKSQIEAELKKQFTNSDSLGKEMGCEEITKSEVTEAKKAGYSLSYQIHIICAKFTGRAVKGELKIMIAIKGSDIDMIGVVAIDKTWDKSGDALEEILSSYTRD